MADSNQQGVTAGLRGAYWDPDRPVPDGVGLSVHALRTHDGASISAFLYSSGKERVAAILMHPREHIVAYYLAAELTRQGMAVCLPTPRLVGNDIRLEHEVALFDVAAAIGFLKASGFEKIVLVGNSGGGPLFAFYNQQALLAPEKRLTATPAGKPVALAELEMIVPDGLIFVSTHMGQGRLLMNGIDPSVVDEADPLRSDPALNPFSPANGFSGKGASYAPDFVERYRAAQVDRVRRLDQQAREMVARRGAARKRLKDGGGQADRIESAHTPIFTVWRTDADLRCWDLSLDPSDRKLGSLWGANPAVSNWGSIGFGRVCTADSWLSTWSGLSSNASIERCAPAIEQPTLFIEYTGDASTFPAETDAMFGWIGTSEKSRVKIAGDHHGRPIHQGDPNPRPLVGEAIGKWVGNHFHERASQKIKEPNHAG
jgi:pimeloyl-ACP methyl ester carboxylesterase